MKITAPVKGCGYFQFPFRLAGYAALRVLLLYISIIIEDRANMSIV